MTERQLAEEITSKILLSVSSSHCIRIEFLTASRACGASLIDANIALPTSVCLQAHSSLISFVGLPAFRLASGGPISSSTMHITVIQYLSVRNKQENTTKMHHEVDVRSSRDLLRQSEQQSGGFSQVREDTCLKVGYFST